MKRGKSLPPYMQPQLTPSTILNTLLQTKLAWFIPFGVKVQRIVNKKLIISFNILFQDHGANVNQPGTI